MPQSGHWYLGDVVDEEDEDEDEDEDKDVVEPPLDTPVFSIFGFAIVELVDVLPADDLPLSLPGEDKSSGVTGGGDLSDPELKELVGDKPQ